MADNTAIEWADATWNPIRARNLKTGKVGWHCEHATTGCEFCYAEGFNRRLGTGLAFKPGHRKDTEIFLDEKMLLQPLRWKKPRMIFVCSMTDLFADFVTDEMLDRIFAVMALTPWHTYQVLTKRAERMRGYLSDVSSSPIGRGGLHLRLSRVLDEAFNVGRSPNEVRERLPLPNVWLGVSAERQQEWDERKEHLRATPAAVRFASFEPLLGPIIEPRPISDFIHQAIVGGESGPKARPMHPDWARSLQNQCAAADVAFFFKQWGEWAPGDAFGLVTDGPVTDRRGNVRDWMKRYVVCPDRADRVDGHSFTEHATNLVYRVGKKRAGRLLDDVEHNGMPAVRS